MGWATEMGLDLNFNTGLSRKKAEEKNDCIFLGQRTVIFFMGWLSGIWVSPLKNYL
jgi:hypothetical protein